MPKGKVAFLDGNASDPLSVQDLNSGFAGLIVPSLSSGVHSFTAVYRSEDGRYDATASTATVMVVEPNILLH
jgi:hypothetical protein